HLQDARTLVRPHAGTEAVGGVVRLFDRLTDRAEREDAEHWTENLLARDAMALRHAGENRRRHEEALRRPAKWRLPHLGAFLPANVQVALNRRELLARDDGV